MKPQQSTKNCINMHDIVAQPIKAVAGAVNAILRRPEELDEAEVRSIFDETSFILLRAEEALMASEEEAFRALFMLLNKGFAHSAKSFNRGIEVFCFQVMLLEVLEKIFCRIIKLQGFPLQGEAVAGLLHTIGNLCDDDSTKDVCGRLFIEGLSRILVHLYSQDVEETHRHFVTQRAAVEAMIKLMKRSPRNRKLITSWDFLANCCALSVDAFFQLQCIELLYRVSRSNKSIFKNIQSRLTPEVIEKLSSLSNNAALISDMMNALSAINRDRNDLVVLPLEGCEVSGVELEGPATCYFAPHYFVIIFSRAVSEGTLRYSSVRSAKFVGKSNVLIRVYEFPASLVAELPDGCPKGDGITLRMGEEERERFKASPIHSWVSAGMKSRMRAQWAPGEIVGSGVTSNDSVAPVVALDRCPRDNADRKRHREGSLEPAGKGKECALLDLSRSMGHSSAPLRDATNHLVEPLKLENEVFPGEVASIMSTTMDKIQQTVCSVRETTDGYRDHVRMTVEGAIRSIENSLVTSHSQAVAAVEKLNCDLQEQRVNNTGFQERIACIEIAAQQALEESRRNEMAAFDLLRKELGQHAERYADSLDDELIRMSDPLNAFSTIFSSKSIQDCEAAQP